MHVHNTGNVKTPKTRKLDIIDLSESNFEKFPGGMAVVVVLVCALAIFIGVKVPDASAVVCQKMSIPAYFYPGPLWTQAISGAPKVEIMILNPSNGPGTNQDPNYVKAVNSAKAAGIKVVGYVYTSYAERDMDTVKSDIDAYKRWYDVSGIFLDEVSSSVEKLAYYQKISKHIKSGRGTFVAMNPGVVPARGYITISDTTVIFEDTYVAYTTWKPPSWVSNYPATKFTHLVYGVSSPKDIQDVISRSKSRNARYVYATNDTLPNPWDTLPSSWSTELKAINLCR